MAWGPAPPKPKAPPAWALNMYGDTEPSRMRARIGRVIRRYIEVAAEHDDWLDRREAERLNRDRAIKRMEDRRK